MVEGTSAATTPIGTPKSQVFSCSFFPRRPTTFWSLMASNTRSAANRFLMTLCSRMPNPVSSTASWANSRAWSLPTLATAATSLSSSPCSILAKASPAALARRTHSRAS